MIRLRSRISYSQPTAATFTIQSNVGRRILFGGIAALLFVAFLVSADWGEGVADGRVAGTIFYFSLVAVCVAVAGWNSMVVLDKSDNKAHFVRRLFGLVLGHSTMNLSDVRAVVVQCLRFLREQEQPALGSTRMRSYMERRTYYFKLHLETAEKLHFVEDSTDSGDLEAAGQAMAGFLNVTYRREEL